MSDMRMQLADMAEGLFADLAGADFVGAWPRLTEAGFAGLLVAEADGGFGGDWGDFYAVMRLAGLHALAAPLGETIIAHKLLADAGIDRPANLEGGAIGLAVAGARIPFGRDCAAVLVADGGELQLYARDACAWDEGRAPQGEPRDRLSVTGAPLATFSSNHDVLALGAFARVAQSAGALDAGFALAIDHVNARVQFGKPLAKFQAVQQALAMASEHIAAVACAGQAAAVALDLGDASFEIAAAKLRTNLAIEAAVPVLHRVHGAIGFTIEYPLNHFTRRLMGWRGEFGNDALWARRLGNRVAKQGGTGLWREITARGDRTGAGRAA